ncbi:MAG TPA: tRNA (adenosine(37)-N6)-threonylcarbamoyltransferase complex ATPase subunit type 1 TsaE, partial [Candidatus Paceibacterota bacterium]|nr:tRNA (adenosine(37)-N6)-threonylcarbamoyltransferase complex ATPase subunit type 1 TsaE [Candidatus Paceibacterota bacterium]
FPNCDIILEMKKVEFISNSSKETKKLGKYFVSQILKILPLDKALVISLTGELGSGKTTFIQGMSEGLKIKAQINSPSFVIMKKFDLLFREVKSFYHFDLWRITKKDLLDLGFEEILKDPSNIVVLEWAEKAQDILPKDSISIEFKHLSLNQRKIIFKFPI